MVFKKKKEKSQRRLVSFGETRVWATSNNWTTDGIKFPRSFALLRARGASCSWSVAALCLSCERAREGEKEEHSVNHYPRVSREAKEKPPLRPDHGCSARNSRASDYNLASPGRRESKMAAGGRVVLPVVGWLRGWLTGWSTRTGRSRKRSWRSVKGIAVAEHWRGKGGEADASHNPLRVERTLALPHGVQQLSLALQGVPRKWNMMYLSNG